jgi:cell division transport system permease protein
MAGTSTLPLDQDGSARFLPWLIGLMVFLAALATGAGFAIDMTLIRWDDGLRGTLTVQLPQPAIGGPLSAASVDQALLLLRSTAGVTSAAALDASAEAALLQPWLGDSVEAGQLPLPVLIDVQRAEGVPLDVADLTRRLAAIVPGTTVETHGAWLEQLFRVARLIEIGAALVVTLIGTVAVLTVIFTTRTGLMIHAPIVDLLHVMGAGDTYIARQFQWQAFRLGLRGGIIGLVPAFVAFGALEFAAAQGGSGAADLAPELSLPLLAWLVIGLLPLAMGLVGLVTARVTVLRTLARMP